MEGKFVTTSKVKVFQKCPILGEKMKIMIKNNFLAITDLWGTKVMYCYEVKWPVFRLILFPMTNYKKNFETLNATFHQCELWQQGLQIKPVLNQKALFWNLKSWILNLTSLFLPEDFSISPSKAETREDFPEPTVPTMAVKEPFFTARLISSRTVGSSLDHLKKCSYEFIKVSTFWESY